MYVLRHFEEVSVKNDELLVISLEDLLELISDDLLNVRDEAVVWECCLRWIHFDVMNRRRHVLKLLEGVRLGLLQLHVSHARLFSCRA